jgi:hypothetical protein
MQPQPVNLTDEQREAYALAGRALNCLTQKQVKVQDKYDYYDADNDISDFGISTPIRMRHVRPGVGWASRAVNTLSDRVVFDGFANDTFGINTYLEQIGGLTVINKDKHDAYIAGCAFIAVSDEAGTGRKVLVPFTAQEATGEIDQTTGLLKYGLAVTKWAQPKPKKPGINYAPKNYILFTPEYTAVFESRYLVAMYRNTTGRTMLHPLTRRASTNRPLGKSRISNTVRRIINEVGRLKRREEIAEEFYALPQRYITGLADGADVDPNLSSAIGKVWTITQDEEGNHPDIGQLTQMSIDGFVEAKKDKARDFCAETALTLRNLGYETGNPTSAESLSAMSDDLLLEAQNSQEEMGKQIKELAITLYMATQGISNVPENLQSIVPSWKPIFQVDVSSVGDSVFKLNQVMPEIFETTEGYAMLGVGIRRAEELLKLRKAAQGKKFMQDGGAA